MGATETEPESEWVNRIVRYEAGVDPASLKPNPMNPRVHPETQMTALGHSLTNLGWVGVVTVNERTGFVVDGHARLTQAIDSGNKVPVLYVDLDPDKEIEMLRDFDPITSLSGYDPDMWAAIVDMVGPPVAELDALMSSLLGVGDEFEAMPPPGDADTGGVDVLYRLVIECANETDQLDKLALVESVGLTATLAVI